MKKKSLAFMFLSVAALGLTACGDKGSEASNGTSTNPHVGENISVAGLKSIFNSFTAKGSMIISYNDGTLPEIYDVYLAMTDEGLETYDENYEEITQVLNIDGVQGYYVLDADNVVKYAPYYDQNYNYIEYGFSLLADHQSAFKTTYFEMTESGTYAVTNQNVRNLIASTLAATYYYTDYYGDIATMELTVENDKVTTVTFDTEKIAVDNLTEASIHYELEISKHGTTEIECKLEPYATYPEAKALGDAFKALGSNVTVELTISSDSGKVYGEGKAYLFDDLYYVSYTDYMYDGYFSETFGYVEYSSNLLGFTVNDGDISAEGIYTGYSLKTAGLQYVGSGVAPEMFEYTDGKYVSRSYRDVQVLAPWLFVDFDGYAAYTDKLTITLDEEGNLDNISFVLWFYVDETRTDVEAHNYVVKVTPNEDKVTDVEGLDDFKGAVAAFAAARVNSEMFGIWADEEETYSVEIDYGMLKINGERAKITSVSQTSVTGKIGSTVYTASYGQELESGYYYVDLSIDGGEAIRLYYAGSFIDDIASYLGIEKLVKPEDFGLTIADWDDTYLYSNKQVLLYYFSEDGITSELFESYVDELTSSTGYYYDITDELAAEFLQGVNTNKTLGEYLGYTYVLSNESNVWIGLDLMYVPQYDMNFLVIWIWA
ncbi:MAG: hypothetical protein J1F32_03465 [Erysipelotrichales bacterium]|nr:hypothetical protein [Erysipelotrichales bacterium]